MGALINFWEREVSEETHPATCRNPASAPLLRLFERWRIA